MKAILFYIAITTITIFISGIEHFLELGFSYFMLALILTITSVVLNISNLTIDDVKKYSGYNLFNKFIKDNED